MTHQFGGGAHAAGSGVRRLAAKLVLVLGLGLGCGGNAGRPAGGGELRIRTEVHVIREGTREPLGIDPEQARIAAAAAALEKSLGRTVAVEVDAALTPASAAGLDTQTASSLESLARYFSRLRSDAVAREFVQRKLTRIAARYRASAEHSEATFEHESGTLIFTMRAASWGGWAPAPFSIDRALEAAIVVDLEARFAGRREADLKNDDLGPYFWLITSRRSDRGKPQPEAERAREAEVETLLRFERRARGTNLHADVEKRLSSDVGFVADRRRQTPAAAPMRAAYAKWIEERFFVMPKQSRSELYEKLLGRTHRDEVCTSDPCAILPELDRVKLALGFFGKAAPPDEGDFDAFDQALCLHVEKDGTLERGRSCSSVYEFFLATEPHADRLVDALVNVKRRELLVAALANARDRMPVLLASLERRGGPLHAEAIRILLDLDDYRFRDHRRQTLPQEVTRLWPKRPDLRPVLLRVVVENHAKSGRDDESMVRIGNELGPIDAALFAKFLDEGPRAVELAPRLWPALKQARAPFDLIAARLDGFVAKRGLDASKTISALVKRACEARDLEGLRVVRSALERRVKGGDKDAAALALLARDCRVDGASAATP